MYTCPCCGYKAFSEPGSYEICHICFWEDDSVQSADPWFAGGANKPCLADGQKNYAKFGAMEERFVSEIKPPTDKDEIDLGWRPVMDSDKNFVTTPKEIEDIRERGEGDISYDYWMRNKA